MANRAVRLVFVALLLTAGAFGQSTTGVISGTVKDTTGTALAGAIVVITSPPTGISRILTTGNSGMFSALQLPPGTYTITVEKPGFSKVVKSGVTLTASNTWNVGDLVLEAGNSAQTVNETVDGGQLELQSSSGERSGLLTNTQIKDLSLNGRNMLDLLVIVPGVLSFVNGQVSGTAGLNSIFINGTRGNQHELTIDGSSNVHTGTNSALHVTINPDAVAEVKVLTSNYQAEYGRSAGGFIQFVTQSGTRDIHGTARLFHRHEGLNANNYFRNAEGRNPDGPEIQPRPLYRYNYVGYDIGGPVVLGQWNRSKDKLFFYWNQEFYRQLVPGFARNIRVPTVAERRGDFSQTVDGNGNKIFIRDPNRAGNCNAADQTACFQGNIIPQDRFFQDGPAILNLYPLPNFAGEDRFNYTSSLSNNYPRREDIIRLDYNLSERTRLSVRYIHNDDSQLDPYGSGNNLPLSPFLGKGAGHNGVISLLHAFSSTLSNEFIFGPSFGGPKISAGDKAATRRANKISFPLLFPNANSSDYIPNFMYGGIPSIPAFPTANFNSLPVRNLNRTLDFSDNLSKVWGPHVIKTGVFIQRSRTDRTESQPVASNINFSSNANNPLNTGHPFANALLGIYNNYTQANYSPRPFYRYTNVEGYVQDNWKIMPRLTLDYGLRIAWYQAQYAQGSLAGSFNPALYDRAKAVRLYEPVLVGNQQRAVDPANRPATLTPANTLPSSFIALIVPGSGDIANGIGQASQGYPPAGFDSRGPQWGPRFGFAYDMSGSGKTVIRGGFGIYYDRIQGGGTLAFATLANPPTLLRPSLAFGRLQDLAAGGGTLAPPVVFGFARDGKIPTVYSMSLGVQREVGFHTVVDVAYVGTLSRHLPQAHDLEAIPYGTTFTREAQDPSLYPGGVVPDVEPNLPEAYRQAGLKFSGANAKRLEFLVPFPGYNSIEYKEFAGSANYHSLQAALNRRFSQGLQFGISYTWSKAMGTANTDADLTHTFDTRRYDYRLASFDRQHVLGAGIVYDVPKLSPLLGGHSLLKAVFDNWQVSGIATISSGAPLELGVAIPGIAPNRLTGSYNQGARFYLARAPQPGPNGLQIDPGAFILPRIGDTGPWPRQYLRGPGMNNQNIAVFKKFQFGAEDHQYVQLRVEMFNAFNHTQFMGINGMTNLAVPLANGGFATGAAIFNDYSRAVITNNLRPVGSTEPLGRFFGEYNSALRPRIIQLGVKLYF